MQIIVLVSINTKNSMKQRELAEKSQFFQTILKMGSFGQNAKRRPFAFCSRQCAHAQVTYQDKNSTSGRRARASYQTISFKDFGPWVAFVS